MTANTASAPVVYPVHYNAAGSRCSHCWQRWDDIATCEHPIDGDLRRLCGLCYRDLAAGRAVELTDDELAAMWRWLAVQHINQRAGEDTGVTDEDVDRALGAHTPAWMPPQFGWARFEELCEDLLRLQAAEDPDTVLDAEITGPDHDPETYLNECRGLVDDTVHKLIGRRP